MPSTGNLSQPFQMPEFPQPQQSPTPVETYADQQKQQGAQMPPVYYGGRAGSAAFIADKVLSGWMAGRKIAIQRQQDKMAQEVGAAKTGLDYIGQAYRAAVESGDQQKIKETTQALHEAYNDYLNKAEKYALPEDEGKKKTTGQKIKSGLKRFAMGGDNPHLPMAVSSLEVMRKADPTQLFGPSKQEQQQSDLLDMQTRQMKEAQQDYARWKELSDKPESEWTPKDKQFHARYEEEHFGKTTEQQLKDDLLTKLASGQQLNTQQKQLAENFGLVKPNQTTAQVRTVRGPNGQPQSQIIPITTTPDGQVSVGVPIKLPGQDYVGPNQAELAGQVINSQMQALMKFGAKAHPEWNQKTADGRQALTSWALTTLYPPTAGTVNWGDQNAKMDAMSRAINAVVRRHMSKRKDPNDPNREIESSDPMLNAMMGNVITTSGDGRYVYLPSLGPASKTDPSWWAKLWGSKPAESWSGLTRDQLYTQERMFQAELRAELKNQNKKMPDSQIDSWVPQALSRPQMENMPSGPTTAQAADRTMENMPDGGQEEHVYIVTFPNGGTATRTMSPEYADALRARGIKVEQPAAGQ